MKLSQGVEWGLHCVTLLAEAGPGTTLRRDELARYYELPEAYLAKHLQAMTRAGVLRATPGPKGGYRLGRPAGEITMLDVVDAIEGTAAPFDCQEIRQRGPVRLKPEECRRACAISTVMRQAHNAYRAHLRSITIAYLVEQVPATVRERIVQALAKP
jgi:Rrf2 family protein